MLKPPLHSKHNTRERRLFCFHMEEKSLRSPPPSLAKTILVSSGSASVHRFATSLRVCWPDLGFYSFPFVFLGGAAKLWSKLCFFVTELLLPEIRTHSSIGRSLTKLSHHSGLNKRFSTNAFVFHTILYGCSSANILFQGRMGSCHLHSEPCKSAHIPAAKAAKNAAVILSYDPNLKLPL
ncbi:hypothetical protein Vadar_010440 [Vaccinium darrowii]|uniref:Uncharacterized protein n=1 Tax=Vaccinium darrowii TaxID=229202 RepID=A0ACB7X9D8_9ERIC|nr:hypothetical protein Vadar_010440 [Vaccinium darrowii]